MIDKIKISDNDLLSMDETTGSIVLPIDILPDNTVIENGIKLTVHFLEDPSNIDHIYVVKNYNDLDGTLTLDWIKQLGESLLTEAPLSKTLQKASQKAEKDIKKNDARVAKHNEKMTKKLLARDLNAAGRNWKFYFPDKDGKYTTAVTQEEAKKRYLAAGDNPTPELINAVVTTESDFIVRKGLEDMYRKGVKFTPSSAPGDTINNTPQTETKPETSATEQAPEETSSNVKDSKSQEKGRYDLGISSKTYAHFLKLLYVMRPKIFDAFNNPVDVSDIKTLNDKVKYNNLADFEIDVSGKRVPLITWIKTAVKNKILMERVLSEAPTIQLDSEDEVDPAKIDFKDKFNKAVEQERIAAEKSARLTKENELRSEYADVPQKLADSIARRDPTLDILEMLFDELVPSSGPAKSVAGEFVRSTMRLLFRDSNDGDKFFEGYGLETCGSSANYLLDNGFENDIQSMLDDAYQLADDDRKYTAQLVVLAEHVVERINNDNSLIWTLNEEDSRDYSYDHIAENQPRYEFEIPGSDDIVNLVENHVLTAWDLNDYVEQQLSYESRYFGDAEVSRPWSHTSTSVYVENLTKEGYEWLEDTVNRNLNGFWDDLVADYEDQLTDDSDYEEDEE